MGKPAENVPFGLHLMLDMYGCSPDVLDDKAAIFNLLQTLPRQLGMKILLAPVIAFAQPNGKRDPGGWSGFVLIQESHISVHTFIKRRFVTVDIYSCKSFDTDKSIELLKQVFKPQTIDSEVEVRGKHYPPEDID